MGDYDDIDDMEFELPSSLPSSSSSAPPLPSQTNNTSTFNPYTNPIPIPDQEENVRGWLTLYPIYFDSTKSVKKGRKVPKEYAIPRPTCLLIASAVQALAYPCAVDLNKRHPKDPFLLGRVKVNKKMKKADLLLKVAKRIKLGVQIPKKYESYQEELEMIANPEKYKFGQMEEKFKEMSMDGGKPGMPNIPGMGNMFAGPSSSSSSSSSKIKVEPKIIKSNDQSNIAGVQVGNTILKPAIKKKKKKK
jgi:signal recognition particle subunit SEC65